MTIVKRIVCLANSRKNRASCVAGKELTLAGQDSLWVRPVSARGQGEIWKIECQYEDGSDPRVLDIVDVPLLYAHPEDYQTENWLLDSTQRWAKVGRIDWRNLQTLIDSDGPLWVNGYHTYYGFNDEIPIQIAESLRSSLRLIEVDHLILYVFDPGAQFGNPGKKVQGRFRYGGVEYWLRVTDHIYEQRCLKMPNGEYPIGKSILTVSLGAPFNGASYKLIAAIIQQNEA